MPKHSGVKFHRELQKDKQALEDSRSDCDRPCPGRIGQTDFEEMTMSGPGIYLEKPVRPGSYVSAVCKLLGVEDAN